MPKQNLKQRKLPKPEPMLMLVPKKLLKPTPELKRKPAKLLKRKQRQKLTPAKLPKPMPKLKLRQRKLQPLTQKRKPTPATLLRQNHDPLLIRPRPQKLEPKHWLPPMNRLVRMQETGQSRKTMPWTTQRIPVLQHKPYATRLLLTKTSTVTSFLAA